MIDRFALAQASRGHLEQMLDPDEVFRQLKIVPEAFGDTVRALLTARNPDELSESKEQAYIAGVYDGFILGVKAQCSEHVVICEHCGDGVPRQPVDPVPDEYDPETTTLLCHSCAVARQASMN